MSGEKFIKWFDVDRYLNGHKTITPFLVNKSKYINPSYIYHTICEAPLKNRLSQMSDLELYRYAIKKERFECVYKSPDELRKYLEFFYNHLEFGFMEHDELVEYCLFLKANCESSPPYKSKLIDYATKLWETTQISVRTYLNKKNEDKEKKCLGEEPLTKITNHIKKKTEKTIINRWYMSNNMKVVVFGNREFCVDFIKVAVKKYSDEFEKEGVRIYNTEDLNNSNNPVSVTDFEIKHLHDPTNIKQLQKSFIIVDGIRSNSKKSIKDELFTFSRDDSIVIYYTHCEKKFRSLLSSNNIAFVIENSWYKTDYLIFEEHIQAFPSTHHMVLEKTGYQSILMWHKNDDKDKPTNDDVIFCE